MGENQYSPEAIRRRVAEETGIAIPPETNASDSQQSASQPVTEADDMARIVANARAAQAKHNAEVEKNKPYSMSGVDVVASLVAPGAHALGRKFGVVPDEARNAQSFSNDLQNRINSAAQAHQEALQNEMEYLQNHDYWHSDHAVNEFLPEEHQIPVNQETTGQTRAERTVQGADVDEIGTGRQRQTGYLTRTAQESARLQEQEEIAKKLKLNTNKVLAQYPDVDATKSGLIVSKSPSPQELARQKEIENARQQARRLLEPHQESAKIGLQEAQKGTAAAAEKLARLKNEAAIANEAAARSKTGLSSIVRRAAEAVGSDSKYLPEILRAGSNMASKILGPVAAATAPENIGQGWSELRNGEYGKGAAHIAGGLGGVAALAPLAVGAGLLAPEVGLGVAGAGALASLPALGYDISDIYKNMTEHK